VTVRHRGRKQKLSAGVACAAHLPVRGTPWWVLLQMTSQSPSVTRDIDSALLWLCFIIECGIACFLVYSKFGHHLHPLGYLCAKFCFFHSLHCQATASPWRKIAYSITQSINRPAYLMPWKPKLLLQNNNIREVMSTLETSLSTPVQL